MAAEEIKNGENERTTMQAFMETPYYQNLGIEKLREQAAAYETDDAALQNRAEAQYRPEYESELADIRRQLQTQTQAYDSRRSGVSATYDRMRRQTNEAYDQSMADMDNALTKRGLGRSSLVSAQGAYLENQRNQALAEIGRDESAEIAAINEKIALLTDQAAQSERSLAANYAKQLESRVSDLKEQNRSASIDLQLQIAALQQQGYEAYQQWLNDTRAQELKERQQALKEKEFALEHPETSAPTGTAGSSNGGAAKTDKYKTTKAASSAQADRAREIAASLTAALGALRQRLTSNKSGGTSGAAKRNPSASKRQVAKE